MRFYSHCVQDICSIWHQRNCLCWNWDLGKKGSLFSVQYIDKFGTKHKCILLSVESTDTVLKTGGIESTFDFMCTRVWVRCAYLGKLIVISLHRWAAARRSLSVKVSAIKCLKSPVHWHFHRLVAWNWQIFGQFCHTQWFHQFAFNLSEWAIFCNIID